MIDYSFSPTQRFSFSSEGRPFLNWRVYVQKKEVILCYKVASSKKTHTVPREISIPNPILLPPNSTSLPKKRFLLTEKFYPAKRNCIRLCIRARKRLTPWKKRRELSHAHALMYAATMTSPEKFVFGE